MSGGRWRALAWEARRRVVRALRPRAEERRSRAPARVIAQGRDDVFVAPEDCAAYIAQGALVLDARGALAYRAGHVPGAVHAPWRAFVEGERARSGRLGALASVERALRERGVCDGVPVVVYGAWEDGWGEEGRIAWMLECLGHAHVRIVYGGLAAWRAQGGRATLRGTTPAQGDFRARWRPSLRAELGELVAHGVGEAGARWAVLDVRSAAEFEGATPHGSARGGRIPGAVHVAWDAVFDGGGALRSPQALEALLGAQGITRDGPPLVVYCVGGVRSGFVAAVLRWAGFERVRNYDGSWWEWAETASCPIER